MFNLRSLWIVIALAAPALLGIIIVQTISISQAIRLNDEMFGKRVLTALGRVSERLEREEIDAAAQKFDYRPTPSARLMELKVEEIYHHLGPGDTVQQYSTPPDEVPHDTLMHQLSQRFFTGMPAKVRPPDFEKMERDVMGWFVMRSEVPVEERTSLDKLDKLVKYALQEEGIETEYIYGVYSNTRNAFVMARLAGGKQKRQEVNRGDTRKMYDAGLKGLINSPYQAKLFPDSKQEPGLLVLHFPNKLGFTLRGLWLTMLGSFVFTCIVLGCFIYTVRVIFSQKKISEIKNDFINNMTHEFKTPIATISLATEAINNFATMGKVDKIERFSNIIKQENTRMHGQVERVLQMAQLDRKELQMNLSDLNFHDLIQTSVNNFSLQVEQRGGHIHLDLKSTKPLLRADVTHIGNVIHNLLDNANKYSPEIPDITIRTKDVTNGIQLSVEDKGLGIAKESRKLIFDKFYRESTGNLHDVKGFGLGLSYVKAIVEAHSGTIDLRSELGKGSTFIVYLPYRTD